MRNIFLYIFNLSLHSSITAIFRKVQNQSVIKKTVNFLDALTIECLGADEDIFVFHHVQHFANISKIRNLGFVQLSSHFLSQKLKSCFRSKSPANTLECQDYWSLCKIFVIELNRIELSRQTFHISSSASQELFQGWGFNQNLSSTLLTNTIPYHVRSKTIFATQPYILWLTSWIGLKNKDKLA